MKAKEGGKGVRSVNSMANLRLSDRLAPYERRVIELLRNSKDKRARKLAKKRVRSFFPPIFISFDYIWPNLGIPRGRKADWLPERLADKICLTARNVRSCEEEGR